MMTVMILSRYDLSSLHPSPLCDQACYAMSPQQQPLYMTCSDISVRVFPVYIYPWLNLSFSPCLSQESSARYHPAAFSSPPIAVNGSLPAMYVLTIFLLSITWNIFAYASYNTLFSFLDPDPVPNPCPFSLRIDFFLIYVGGARYLCEGSLFLRDNPIDDFLTFTNLSFPPTRGHVTGSGKCSRKCCWCNGRTTNQFAILQLWE